jgi:hypothetical protein
LIDRGSQFPYAEASASCKAKQACETDEQDRKPTTQPRRQLKSGSTQLRFDATEVGFGGSKDRGKSSDCAQCGEDIEDAHDATRTLDYSADARRGAGGNEMTCDMGPRRGDRGLLEQSLGSLDLTE